MIIYENRRIRDELLSKLEEFEPSSKFSKSVGWDELPIHSDNYFKLYSIINNYESDLSYLRHTLLEIIDKLSKSRKFIERDYGKYTHYCRLYNLRLSILECRLQYGSGGRYHHEYFAMEYLPMLGCKPGQIHNLMGEKNGSPDFKAESIFGNEWEIKMITGNKIAFTRLQLKKFNRNVNILIYRIVESHSYNHIGAKFHNHIKFGDIYDVLLEKKSYIRCKIGNKLLNNIPVVYQITAEDSSDSAKSIIKNRYIQEEYRTNSHI